MDKIKPYVIGLDLGGTNAVFGIVDARGNIIATTAIKTQAYPVVEDFVEAGCTALEPIIEEVGGIDKIQLLLYWDDRKRRKSGLERLCSIGEDVF